MTLPLSILDLATVGSGMSPTEALEESGELVKRTEELGFKRHWFAEHHSTPSVASSSPEILMANAAAVTERIRIGSGGIMLPNHVPLQVAERFHTLEALHPDRIDLGIGRAPGTDRATQRALRAFDASKFASQLDELLSLSRRDFERKHPFSSVRVLPDDVDLPPIWILGSSGASARLAGELGLGYSFASHFSQNDPRPALEAYRKSFEPSEQFDEPHVMMAVGAICAETEERADHLAKSWDLAAVRLRKGVHTPFPTPEEAIEYDYNSLDRQVVEKSRKLQFIGAPDRVRDELDAFVDKTGADELMVATFVHSHQDRLTSIELLADAFELST